MAEKVIIPGARVAATPLARTLARRFGIALASVPAAGAIRARDVERYRGMAASNMRATPLAARIAREQGIDLTTVTGSGRGGKIFSADLPRPAAGCGKQSARAVRVPLTTMRKTIARRMLGSHLEIPPVTLHSEADVTRLCSLRRELNSSGDTHISFNDLAVRAAAVALSDFPAINASFSDDGILRHEDINIGVAVALEDGLIVPVLHNADRYSMKELSEKARDLTVRARESKLRADEYSGGTFTVTNLGAFGVTAFTPIINLPEACILGVCAIRDRLALSEDGAVVARKYMGLSLTFDHRCLDGAISAKFLQRIAALLENPAQLLL